MVRTEARHQRNLVWSLHSAVSKLSIILFSPHCLSSLSCVNEDISKDQAIDNVHVVDLCE